MGTMLLAGDMTNPDDLVESLRRGSQGDVKVFLSPDQPLPEGAFLTVGGKQMQLSAVHPDLLENHDSGDEGDHAEASDGVKSRRGRLLCARVAKAFVASVNTAADDEDDEEAKKKKNKAEFTLKQVEKLRATALTLGIGSILNRNNRVRAGMGDNGSVSSWGTVGTTVTNPLPATQLDAHPLRASVSFCIRRDSIDESDTLFATANSTVSSWGTVGTTVTNPLPATQLDAHPLRASNSFCIRRDSIDESDTLFATANSSRTPRVKPVAGRSFKVSSRSPLPQDLEGDGTPRWRLTPGRSQGNFSPLVRSDRQFSPLELALAGSDRPSSPLPRPQTPVVTAENDMLAAHYLGAWRRYVKGLKKMRERGLEPLDRTQRLLVELGEYIQAWRDVTTHSRQKRAVREARAEERKRLARHAQAKKVSACPVGCMYVGSCWL